MSPHERLFENYRRALLAVKPDIEDWWADMLSDTQAPNTQTAKRTVMRRWPSGPAAHPRILAIIRATYLACLELNDDDDVDAEVQPHTLLTEWLLDGSSDELVEFLAPLSYWPIGFDEDGEEC